MTDPSDEGFPAVVSRVIDDAKEVARAEIALVKAQAFAKLAAYRAAAILFAAAGLIALLAAIGLVVGLILTLATQIGPGLATLAVVGVFLLVAGLLGWLGSRRLKQG